MKINKLSLVFFAATASQFNSAYAENNIGSFHSSMSLLGSTHLHYDPVFVDQVTPLLSEQQQLDGVAPENRARHTESCNPADIDLTQFKQWEQERGYWIGTYTFLGGDGKPFNSASWNYPYGDYKGFITGEVFENAYRQRNVFLYPPQDTAVCDTISNVTTGEGVCGINGNTKIFSADQEVTSCDEVPYEGTIEGLYAGMFPTKTTLIGNDNALLYQVLFPDGNLLQSQLTTMSENAETKQLYRTRSAQGFAGPAGLSTSCSYYRERKVTEEEFFDELESSIAAYNIASDDLCKYDNMGNAVIPSGSIEACADHLNQSFELEADIADRKAANQSAQPSTQPSAPPTAQPSAQPSLMKRSKKAKGSKKSKGSKKAKKGK